MCLWSLVAHVPFDEHARNRNENKSIYQVHITRLHRIMPASRAGMLKQADLVALLSCFGHVEKIKMFSGQV